MELPNSSSNSFCFSRCTWFEKTRTSCVAFKFFPFFFLSLSIGNIPPKHPTAKCKFRDPRRPGGKDLHRKWMECLNGEVSIDTTGIVSPPSRFFGTWEGGTFPYFLACWYRGYVSAPGDCLFCVEKWEKLMAVLVHASWLLSYWVFDMFTSMSGKFHRHPWQSMLHLHPLEDPATLIGSLIYTPWKFNISASISKVSISLSKAWTYPQHHCQETSKSKHITKKQCVYIYIYWISRLCTLRSWLSQTTLLPIPFQKCHDTLTLKATSGHQTFQSSESVQVDLRMTCSKTYRKSQGSCNYQNKNIWSSFEPQTFLRFW